MQHHDGDSSDNDTNCESKTEARQPCSSPAGIPPSQIADTANRRDTKVALTRSTNLPPEVWHIILEKCDKKSLSVLRFVNRDTHEMVERVFWAHTSAGRAAARLHRGKNLSFEEMLCKLGVLTFAHQILRIFFEKNDKNDANLSGGLDEARRRMLDVPPDLYIIICARLWGSVYCRILAEICAREGSPAKIANKDGMTRSSKRGLKNLGGRVRKYRQKRPAGVSKKEYGQEQERLKREGMQETNLHLVEKLSIEQDQLPALASALCAKQFSFEEAFNRVTTVVVSLTGATAKDGDLQRNRFQLRMDKARTPRHLLVTAGPRLDILEKFFRFNVS